MSTSEIHNKVDNSKKITSTLIFFSCDFNIFLIRANKGVRNGLFLLLKACVSCIFHNTYYVIFNTNKTISQSFKQQPVEPSD
ncbi:hypothetical protein wTkk_000371 [Wolbachia endosymbiont of Trichogramma kaykai]